MRNKRLLVVVLALFALVLAGLIVINLAKAPDAPRLKAPCKRNIKTILLACAVYAHDHNGIYPSAARAQELLKPHLTEDYDWTFGHKDYPPEKCPYEFSQSEVVWEEKPNYVPGSWGLPVPYLWDKIGNHQGGRNVGFSDGHVEWVREDAFQKLIESSNNRIKTDQQ